ncbi:hypothetical protein AAHB46_00645 [Bacillus paranthracis]
MAYLNSTKAAGNRYFYLSVYTGRKKHTCKKYKNVYSFGNQNIALERLSLWLLDKKFIPKELIDLGISREDVSKWRKKCWKWRKKHLSIF